MKSMLTFVLSLLMICSFGLASPSCKTLDQSSGFSLTYCPTSGTLLNITFLAPFISSSIFHFFLSCFFFLCFSCFFLWIFFLFLFFFPFSLFFRFLRN